MLYFLTTLEPGNDYSIYKLFLIFLISFFANTFSSISGGGAGLVQLPALILLGLPYYQALSTHKAATVALGLGGTIRNFKSLSNYYFISLQILFFGTPGVILGSKIVQFLSDELLYIFLGCFSIFLAIYSLFKKELGINSLDKKISTLKKLRFWTLIFFIGILNGSISSGTGLLVTILLIKTFGMDFLRAIGITFFTVGIFWNAIGAFFLSRIGVLPFNILLVLLLGSFLGGYFGAHLSNVKGNKLIKNSFTIVCFLVGISLIIKSIVNFI